MKKVFKYGTGQEIPKGAIYLTTLAETRSIDDRKVGGGHTTTITKNEFVWHYFLVEVPDGDE